MLTPHPLIVRLKWKDRRTLIVYLILINILMAAKGMWLILLFLDFGIPFQNIVTSDIAI